MDEISSSEYAIDPRLSRLRWKLLRSDEYTKMLSLAGASPRDYAILQVFLQTGIRVSELANLRLEDIEHVVSSRFEQVEGELSRLRSAVYLLGKDRPEVLRLLGQTSG